MGTHNMASSRVAAQLEPCYNSAQYENGAPPHIPRPTRLMHMPIRTCVLVGKFQDPRVAECAQALVPELLSRHLEVLAPEDSAAASVPSGVRVKPLAEFIERADLMIAIGGEGTRFGDGRLVAAHHNTT